MQRRVPILPLLFLAVISAPAQMKEQREAPIRPVDGASIFRSYCAACHGLDGRGNGPVSASLKKSAADLTKLSQRNGGTFPGIHVRNTITFGADELLPSHGSQAMPIWGNTFHQIEFDQDLGNVRLENITNYLESIQKK